MGYPARRSCYANIPLFNDCRTIKLSQRILKLIHDQNTEEINHHIDIARIEINLKVYSR